MALELPRSSFYNAAEATIWPSFCRDIPRRPPSLWLPPNPRELQDHELACAPARLRRLMHLRGLRAIQPKNYPPKTSDGRADRPSANLLARQPLRSCPTRPGPETSPSSRQPQKFSRRGHRPGLTPHPGQEPECPHAPRPRCACLEPISAKSPFGRSQRNPIFPVTGAPTMTAADMRQSMSARPYPYANAWTESFMGTPEREMLWGRLF